MARNFKCLFRTLDDRLRLQCVASVKYRKYNDKMRIRPFEVKVKSIQYIFCAQHFRNHRPTGAGRTIIGRGGANIHIFVFTECKNDGFQKKLIRQSTNVWIFASRIIVLPAPVHRPSYEQNLSVSIAVVEIKWDKELHAFKTRYVDKHVLLHKQCCIV